MAEERPAQPGTPPADPSMEDILASIRRILNEDEAGAATTTTPAEPLTLTEEMLVQEPPAAPPPAAPDPFEQADPAPAILAGPAAVAPEPEPPPQPEPPLQPEPPPQPEPPSQPEPSPPGEMLIAPAVAAAATAAIGSLIRAVSQDRGATVTRGGPSIEDVVREELRPLLKGWLDQHLPGLVERLVRAEIERVVGRALG